MRITRDDDTPRFTNGYLFLQNPPVNRPITFQYDLPTTEIAFAATKQRRWRTTAQTFFAPL